jgi:hypothetical protein
MIKPRRFPECLAHDKSRPILRVPLFHRQNAFFEVRTALVDSKQATTTSSLPAEMAAALEIEINALTGAASAPVRTMLLS